MQQRHHLLTLSKGGTGRHHQPFCGLVGPVREIVVLTSSLGQNHSYHGRLILLVIPSNWLSKSSKGESFFSDTHFEKGC